MKQVLIIGTSLSEDSRSQALAERFSSQLSAAGVPCEYIDLRTLELPMAGTDGCWELPEVEALRAKVLASSHVVFSVPIYCFDVNAAAKNVIELVGRAFTDTVIAFICSAGGHSSYMSVMGLANHLMLDFRSVIVPRFLYATGSDWNDDGTLSPDIEERMQRLLDDMQRIRVQAPSD